MITKKLRNRQKRVQEGKFPELKKILLHFFDQCRTSNIPMSGPMLIEKVKKIAMKVKLADCSFTSGWLQKFRVLYRISCYAVSGESRDVLADSVAE